MSRKPLFWNDKVKLKNGDISEIATKEDVLTVEDVSNLFTINTNFYTVTWFKAFKIGNVIAVKGEVRCVVQPTNGSKFCDHSLPVTNTRQRLVLRIDSPSYTNIGLQVTGSTIAISSYNLPSANSACFLEGFFYI